LKKTIFIITILCSSTLAFSQSDRSLDAFNKAKKEFNIITEKDFPRLNCAETINENKMKSFFKIYPQFNRDIQVVSIPNCYGAPNEKFFVLLYDETKEFYIPRSLPDVYKDEEVWPPKKKG